MKAAPTSPRRAALLSAISLCGYGLAFAALTYPRIRQISTHFWADLGDGLENVWNLWWVRKAVVDLHQSPWHTYYLDYPFGITLHAHAFSPFNGFLGIPLAAVLTPVEVHNAIVLFAFLSAGLGAFWLAHAVTGSVAASFLAGYLFTFSGYHFAHTGAHLNLVSIEWLPLFLLCWLRLLRQPSAGAALLAALSLFAIYLCDYYYFFYALLASALFLGVEAWRRRDWLFPIRGECRRAFAVFGSSFALTSGVLLGAGIHAYLESPFVGGHDPSVLSLDLLAPFVPGGHSRFAAHTTWYWQTVPGNVNENSVFLGYGAIVLVVCASLRRRQARRLAEWHVLLAVFALLALGPRLQIYGRELPGLVLPYGWLEALVPPMRMSGVPIRAFVMVTLAVSVLAAVGMRTLIESGGAARALAVLLAVLAVAETLPGSIPKSAPPESSFARVLAAQPGTPAYIEVAEPPLPNGVALYFQTIHEKPMAFGHTSRKTLAVEAGEQRLRAQARAGDYRALHCDYGFRYVVADEHLTLDAPAQPVELWEGRPGRLYDLGAGFAPCSRP